MSIQSVFANTFEETARTAMAGGVKAAPFTAAGFASVNTLTYLTEGAFALSSSSSARGPA